MPDIKVEDDGWVDVEDTDLTEYTYQPLSKPLEIRLVKLFPMKAEDGDRNNRAETLSPCYIELVQTTLEEAPSFIGISYTWGRLKQHCTMLTADNEVLCVTGNVRDILQRLRPEAFDEDRYLWIDQLCIDQANEEEKCKQIRIMRQIYHHALGSFVVLSGQDKAFDEVLWMIGKLEIAPLFKPIRPWSPKHPVSDASIAILADPEFRKALMKIVDNIVFSRAWVYQEIVSSENIYLLGGTLRADWDVFAAVFMVCLCLEAESLEPRCMDSQGVERLTMIVKDRINHQGGGYRDWGLLLTKAQGLLQCSDPRDNVVALTTFQDVYEGLSEYQHHDVSTLYWAITKEILRASQALEVFGAISGHWHSSSREWEGLPSWVPDWSRKRDSIPLYWPTKATAFNASTGYSHSFHEDNEPHILYVRGKKIDTITGHVDYAFEDIDTGTDLPSFFRLGQIYTIHVSHAEARGTPLETSTRKQKIERAQALVAAMTASFSSYSSFTADNFIGEPPAILYAELVFMLDYYDEIMEDKVPLFHDGRPHAFSFMHRIFGGWKSAMSKLRQWGVICSGRRIAFGEGRGFGLVPKTVRGGDVICILHGSKVPIVLRRLGRCYRVIGQCYWHGWMYGDPVDWKEDEGDLFKLV